MDALGPEIGGARRVFADFQTQALELALSDVRQVPALRPLRGMIIKVHRNLKLPPDALAAFFRQFDAFREAARQEGNEGDHVHRPHARVLAPVVV